VKILGLLLLLVSSSAWACWSIDLNLGIDGEDYKFQQKIDHDKKYSLHLGSYILNLKLIKNKNKNKTINFEYKLEERKEKKLIIITQGEEEIAINVKKEIYAKGEENQPHSIITLKLSPL
jgi:hypothetical protein